MKLKFNKTVPAGKQVFQAGQEYEIKDRHAAEVYVAHGYAVAVEGTTTGETLKHSHPAMRTKSEGRNAKAPTAGSPAASK